MTAIVLGAGPAGLTTAAMLKRRGIEAVVLERGEELGHAWRQRYDGLELNTLRWLSSLPGLRLERRYGRWVAKDDFVRYLESYAQSEAIAIETGVSAERVERTADGWAVSTSAGPRRARHVVVATGVYHTPREPEWPGTDAFSGRLVNAAAYRSASDFDGEDVLVVGAGNTGVEIAQELARGGASRVRISVRTTPNIVPSEIFRVPLQPFAILSRRAPAVVMDTSTRIAMRLRHGNLGSLGLSPPVEGVHTASRRGVPPVIDTGFVAAVKRGEIEVVAPVEALSEGGAQLRDGSLIEPSVAIVAVGYEAGLEGLVGHLGVLAADGRPAVQLPTATAGAPGLYFIGYRPRLGGILFDFGQEARRIAETIARH
jgi:cation diffusion facilitator CzcD-associated flavoprotein CzcO